MLQRRPWEKQRNSFKHSSFKVDIKLSFHIEGTRTLKSKGLPGIPSLSLQHYLPTGWGHLVDLASVRGIHHYSPWSCCCCLEITFLRAPTDQMLWRASAYGLVSSLSRQDLSWPTHRQLVTQKVIPSSDSLQLHQPHHPSSHYLTHWDGFLPPSTSST